MSSEIYVTCDSIIWSHGMDFIFVVVDILHELFKVVKLEVLSCVSYVVLELFRLC